jgi:hypothetical protein
MKAPMHYSGRVSDAEKAELLQRQNVSARVLEFRLRSHEGRRIDQPHRSPWTVCLALAAAALAIRLAVMPFLYQENLDPERDHWMFGHEQGRVARSIALGQGFANPLFGPTGPTAYPAPIYPYFMGAVFRVFGIYSKSSAIVLIVMNCLFSALTVIPLYLYARRSFGQPTALIAGVLWAVFPYSVYWPIMRIWDTWISALLLSLLFLLALKLADSDALAAWAGFGLLWGCAGLLNPVALAVLPGLVLWMIYNLHRQGKRWLLPATGAFFCMVAMMAPWTVRNYAMFHKFIPVRDNLGLELYVGNDGDDERLYDLQSGPWKNSAEWERFRQLGEIEYFEEKGRAATAFIKAHPAKYALECSRRFVNVWTDFWSLNRRLLADDPDSSLVAACCTLLSTLTIWGLWRSMRKDALRTIPYLIVLFCYPMVYCFTHTADWYRRPIDPFFVVLAAYAFSSFWQEKRDRQTHTMSALPGPDEKVPVWSAGQFLGS